MRSHEYRGIHALGSRYRRPEQASQRSMPAFLLRKGGLLLIFLLCWLSISAFALKPLNPSLQWSGWAEVPGGGQTNAALAPVTVGMEAIFAKGINDNGEYVNMHSYSGSWSGWSLVPGGGTTNVAMAATDYDISYNSEKIFLFAKGINDGGIYYKIYDLALHSWGNWQVVGGTTNVSLAAIQYNNQIYLFSKGGNDNRIYVNTYNSTSWGGWSLVPGNVTTDAALTTAVFQNRLYVFAKRTDGSICYTSFDGSSWANWQGLDGQTDVSLAVVGIPQFYASTPGPQNTLFLLMKGFDENTYIRSFDGSTWSGWSLIPSQERTNAPLSGAWYLTASDTGVHMTVFLKGLNAHIYMNTLS